MNAVLPLLLLANSAGAQLKSSPELGTAAAACRPDESGPAALVSIIGLKDRQGLLKVELYPANDDDFLADDNVLVEAGKTFRRVEEPVPPEGPVTICIRAPTPGTYSLSVLHDRDSNRKFGLSKDGIGFAGNPHLGWSKPDADDASLAIGPGPTLTTVVLNYRRGLFSFGPVRKATP